MNILITSPRAPAVLDWMRVFADADETVLCDSLRFPLAAFAARSNPRVRYCRIPPPRYDFAGYAAAMRGLVAEADFVVPTCEDIFYLAHVPLPESEREKLFMPPRTLLLGLHDKWRFFDYLPRDTAVRLPHTRRLASADDIDWAAAGRSVFKPVYSRFGRRVLVSPRPDALENLHISAAEPWVQQQRIAGKPLCSYAVCERGRVAAQVVYDPMYLVNGSASTYFRRADEPRIHDFVTEFAVKNTFHGQAAFDLRDRMQPPRHQRHPSAGRRVVVFRQPEKLAVQSRARANECRRVQKNVAAVRMAGAQGKNVPRSVGRLRGGAGRAGGYFCTGFGVINGRVGMDCVAQRHRIERCVHRRY